jgi:hypothetical protein
VFRLSRIHNVNGTDIKLGRIYHRGETSKRSKKVPLTLLALSNKITMDVSVHLSRKMAELGQKNLLKVQLEIKIKIPVMNKHMNRFASFCPKLLSMPFIL